MLFVQTTEVVQQLACLFEEQVTMSPRPIGFVADVYWYRHLKLKSSSIDAEESTAMLMQFLIMSVKHICGVFSYTALYIHT